MRFQYTNTQADAERSLFQFHEALFEFVLHHDAGGQERREGEGGLCKVFWAMFYFNAFWYFFFPAFCSVQPQHHGEMENDLNPLSLLQLLSILLPLPISYKIK